MALVGCRVDMGMKLARKEPVGSFVFSSCVRFALVAYSHWLKQSKRKVNMKDTNNQSDVRIIFQFVNGTLEIGTSTTMEHSLK